VVSVGHRRTLVALHDRRLDLGDSELVEDACNGPVTSAITEWDEPVACSSTQDAIARWRPGSAAFLSIAFFRSLDGNSYPSVLRFASIA